ncbi:anti-sigma factor domain-containing protein [Fictibacillus sp. NRS-1165]|uniref:anti-sigma factor domain-containing protein n=1 Tax=Fictibacillus sp. NRS-1165 TaxID=3144463 RepID=UPI003D1CFFC2
MKNGVLMEVKKGKAVLLTKDGCFITVRVPRGEHPVVGMEYSISRFTKSRVRRLLFPSLSLTIGALLIYVLFSGVYPLGRNDNTVAAYVSFDVNPSLETGVNHDLQVIKVKAYNAEGKKILQSLNHKKNVSLSQFASSLLNAYESKGYLTENPDVMIGTTIVDAENDKLSSSLDEAVSSIKRNAAVFNTKAAIMVKSINTEKRKVAQKNGVSSGKYMMYLDAKRKDKNISLHQVKNMSYTELKEKIEPDRKLPKKEINHKKKISEKMIRHPRTIETITIKTSSLQGTSSKEIVSRPEDRQAENNRVTGSENQKVRKMEQGKGSKAVKRHSSKTIQKPKPNHKQPADYTRHGKNTKMKTVPKHPDASEKIKHENHDKKWGNNEETPKATPYRHHEKKAWKKAKPKKLKVHEKAS